LQEIEEQIDGSRKAAQELQFPKYATMTNYFEELGLAVEWKNLL
jgi:hypothetical protein